MTLYYPELKPNASDEAVMLFDLYFTFESKLGWRQRLFLTVESTRGIRTLVVVFELLEEMVAWGW